MALLRKLLKLYHLMVKSLTTENKIVFKPHSDNPVKRRVELTNNRTRLKTRSPEYSFVHVFSRSLLLMNRRVFCKLCGYSCETDIWENYLEQTA